MTNNSGKKGKELKSGKTITEKRNMVFVNNGKQCRARFTLKIDPYTRAVISLRFKAVDTRGAGFEETCGREFHQIADFTPCGNRHDMQSMIRRFFTRSDKRTAMERESY